MGIQDRDYYRDDEPTWWDNAARSRVTYALMLLLAVVFVAQVLGSDPRRGRDDVLLSGGLYDLGATLRGQVWRPVTSFFVHRRDALLAVGVAIWAFYYFGSRVEAHYGSAEYAAYLAATVVGVGLTKVAVGLAGVEANLTTFGSLPLLWSVLTLYVCVAPRSQPFLGTNVPTPVLILLPLGATLALDLAGGSVPSGLVGLVAGVAGSLLYFKLDPQLSRRAGLDRLLGISRPRRGPRLKVARTPAETPREREVATDQTAREILGAFSRPAPVPTPPAALDEQLEAKLDQVLEKVSRSGKDSLTGDEQNILRRASEIYKQRRGT